MDMDLGRKCLGAGSKVTLLVFLAVALAVMLFGGSTSEAAAGQTGLRSAKVKSCPSFVAFRAPGVRYRASKIRRSRHLTCRMTRNLLRAAYRQGPLKVIRETYARYTSSGHGIGRPTYWLRKGWRCSNGAGGAMCMNVRRPGLNVVNGVAVTANVGW